MGGIIVLKNEKLNEIVEVLDFTFFTFHFKLEFAVSQINPFPQY